MITRLLSILLVLIVAVATGGVLSGCGSDSVQEPAVSEPKDNGAREPGGKLQTQEGVNN